MTKRHIDERNYFIHLLSPYRGGGERVWDAVSMLYLVQVKVS
jgi:hypothetical protein